MYHQFHIEQLYVLPHRCIYVFCADVRTNSYYFPIQHKLTGFITEVESVYSAVGSGALTVIQFVSSL